MTDPEPKFEPVFEPMPVTKIVLRLKKTGSEWPQMAEDLEAFKPIEMELDPESDFPYEL